MGRNKRAQTMGKLTTVAALATIGKSYARDLQPSIAQRAVLELSNKEHDTVERQVDISRESGVRKLGDNSVFMFNARNSGGTAPRHQPIDDSDQDQQGVPDNKITIMSSNENTHLLASHGFHSPYYPNTITHTCVNDNLYPHSYLYNVGYYFSHSALECCTVHFSESVDHCTKAVHYEEYQVDEQYTPSYLMPGGKKKPILEHYTELDGKTSKAGIYQSEATSKTAKTTPKMEHYTELEPQPYLPNGKTDKIDQSEEMSKTAKTPSNWEATSWWQGGVMPPLGEEMSKTAKTPSTWEATSWWQGGVMPPLGEEMSKTAKTPSTWETTSWWQGGVMPPPPPPPVPKGTMWWHGAKSNKKSKHCKSAKSLGKDSKSGKSKSEKGCEYLPIMAWPTYSPTSEELPPAPVPSPKMPTMLPVPYPTYAPTTGEVTPTAKPRPPTPPPKQSPTQVPTTKPSITPNLPTTSLEPAPGSPTYAPTSSWPTWNPTTATYAPTGPSTGTMPTTQRPTDAPSSQGPTVPPLDLLVWGSPLSTSQTGGNILTPLDTGIKASDASAGSRYSIIISSDGTASATGVIDTTMDDYDGHLGVNPLNLTEGQNFFQPITLVFDDDNFGVTTPPRFKKAYAGVGVGNNTHTMLIDAVGRVWATGSNDMGQLCLGDEIDRLIPEKISLPSKIVDVAVGGEFTLLLSDDGVVYGCGLNALGQLGLGPELQAVNQPMSVGLSAPAKSISAGKDHSLITTSDGYYVMGSNEFSQLCTDTDGEPLLVPRALEIDEDVAEFQAIKSSSFILYEDGSVNGCGKNDFGQLGDGTNENTFITIVNASEVVTLLGVGPSAESVFFVYEDGTTWGTGLNDKGQLGVGDTDNRNVPTLVKTGEMMTTIVSAAEDHTLALYEEGTDTSYAPSSSPKTSPPTPVDITAAPTVAVPAVNETFFFWGDPKSIGFDGEGFNILEPLNLGDGVADAAAGSQYSMLVLTDGSALSGGFIKSVEDYTGYLGVSSKTVVEGLNTFQSVDEVYDGGELAPAPLFHKVFAGVESTAGTGNIHSILLDRDGRVYATGANNFGQLCLGDESNVVIPTRIPIDDRIVDVAIGGEHTLLLSDAGVVYGCGSNTLGQLGLGDTTIGSSSPVVVSGVVEVYHISAGKYHSLFQAADGIYVTGSNKYGQLCRATDMIELYEPVKLDLGNGIAENIRQFEAISSSSFILYADGSANACGKNDFGQLGDGTNEDSPITTVAIDGAVRMLGVGPSAESAFFVTYDEEIFGTGLNDKGQLGVGDEDDRNIPTTVDFIDDEMMVSVFAAARDQTIVLISANGQVMPPAPTPVTPLPTALDLSTNSPTAVSTIDTTSSPPTKESGNLPTTGEIPTYSPTSTSGTATYSPTSTPKKDTPVPTYSPTSVEQPIEPPIESGDELFYWGSLQAVGSEGESSLPAAGDLIATDVSAGSRYSIIILPDGSAQTAGFIESLDDYHGHLGIENGVTQGANSLTTITNVVDETGESIDTPFFTRAFAGAEQFSSPGSMHTVLLDSDGRVYTVGSNSRGQLCTGDFTDRYIPQRIMIDEEVESVAIGSEHTLLLLKSGEVMGCGSNEFGQLGLGEEIKVENVPTPIAIEGTVNGISSGLAFSLFKSSVGLFVTGSNSYGQLCYEGPDSFVPSQLSLGDISVDVLTSFEAIQASSFILFEDGGVAACGQNNFGQLGNGSNEDVPRALVPIPDEAPIRRLGVGPSALSAFFVNTAGTIYATGLNDRGQLGTGDTTDRNTLTAVEGIAVGADQISASMDHTLAILS